jgi:DNA-binding XRE family transcriptional regulator
MDTIPTEISHCLREARRAKGLTQSELAQRVGCQQSAVSMMESGRATALSQETLHRIAAELGVSIPKESGAAAPVPGVGHAYCPDAECPSNIPFVVNGALVFWPRPQPAPAGRHCAFCGEVLARACPRCGAPAGAGACCRACGASFVPPPATLRADPEAWAEMRRRQIAEWRALL